LFFVLIDVLAEDAVLNTDAGGKGTAAPNPICGPERIARFIGAREELLPSDGSALKRIVAGRPIC
jgi:hypothetical protein